MHKVFLYLTLLFSFTSFAQEFNCTVSINTAQVQQTNKQIFNTLRKSIADFMNNTRFTNNNYGRNERIDCNLVIIIESYESNNFVGTLQVQSSRPIYQSGYNSPVLNYREPERQFTFQYVENEMLVYNDNSYTSELSSVLSFYAQLIIGLDADTFSLNGGSMNFDKAMNILNYAQQGGNPGWRQDRNDNNRYAIITDLLNNGYSGYRSALYEYHRKGLDLMTENPLEGKKGVKKALDELQKVHVRRPNAMLTRMFFDAKADEIVQIFSSGPEIENKQALIDLLLKISPLNGARWYRL